MRQLRDFVAIKHGFAFSSRHFGANGKYIVLTPGHFYEEGGFRHQPGRERFLTVEPLPEFVLPKDALIVAMTEQAPGLLGSCAIVPESNTFLHNQRLGLVQMLRPNDLLADFLYYTFNSRLVRKQVHCAAGGMKVRHTSPGKIGAVWFPYPPVEDQERIGKVLTSLDAALSSLTRVLTSRQELKRGLTQQLLTGQKRFPEFQGRPWHSSRLADHVATVTRRNTKGLPLVLTASGEHGLVDQRRYFNRSVAGTNLTKYYLLRKGEFAYNRSAMTGYPYGATKRLDEHEEGALSTLYLCFAISNPNLDSDFLKHVLESGVLNRQLRPIVRVGARAHGLLNVTEDDYLSISIPLPELDEQRRIAAVLSDLDREIDLLTALRDEIALQKRALLSKLLSGEIPLPA
jgi:type I restriction enzyme S subunit